MLHSRSRAALVELSKQGRLQLVIAASSLPAKTSAALRGSMPLGVAFDQLLKDTGLTYKLVGEHTIAIVKASETSPTIRSSPSLQGLLEKQVLVLRIATARSMREPGPTM